MSSVLLLRPYASTNTPNSINKYQNRCWKTSIKLPETKKEKKKKGKKMMRYIFTFGPWKQSRYSSFCGAVVTWMMEMGKLWEDAAKTAEASVTSFLSKNSAQRIYRSVRQLI